MFAFRRAARFASQNENEKENKEDEIALLEENSFSLTDTLSSESTLTEYDDVLSENTEMFVLNSPKMSSLNGSNQRFVRAWKKPERNIIECNGDCKKTQELPKMAKVVTTASNVDKASKSLLSSTVRKRLKVRMQRIAEERLTVKQIFRRYVDTSTLHGFRYTCSDTYYIRRFIWACLMILGFVYFIVKLKEGIIEYMSYPFSTLSTLEYVDSLEFPAISFCTVNQFRKSKILQSPLKRLYEHNRLPIHINWSDPGYDITGKEFVEEMNKTSFSIADIFKECDYISRDTDHPKIDKQNCSYRNFTSYFSQSGQLCFTLNSGKVGYRKLHVDHEGMKFGFEAMFDLQNDDAVQYFRYSGLQAIIHHQDELSTSNVGFMVTPGFKTFVSMQRVETKNLPPPYDTHCGEKQLKYHEKYSQKACLLEAMTDYTGEKCGCREAFMPENGLPYCSLRETILCSLAAKESFHEYEKRQDCPIDCEITSYTTHVSSSRFLHNPPKGMEPLLLKNGSHLLKLSKQMSQEQLDQYIEQNIIVIIFFFGEMNKLVNEQEASFDFYQFLGDMGGEIGLMLGASLLTFVEFIDLFAFLGYHQILRLHKRKRNESESRKQSMNMPRTEETASI